jgi:predicted transposase YbfD/YdcC
MVESRREHGEKGESARRYALVSLPADGVRFSDAVRQPWGVENQWPWVLEVSCAEDASRIRPDKGAQTFSVLRPIAVHLLRRESQHKRGSKARRKRAGWDRDYLVQVLTG